MQALPHSKPLFDCGKRRFAPPQPTSDGMFIAAVAFWNEPPTEMQAAVKRSTRLMLRKSNAFRKQQYTKEKKMITPLAATSNETDFLTYEVSDEMLESAGSKETAAAFTLGSCTGLSECPG
jgi:hypothetical protein